MVAPDADAAVPYAVNGRGELEVDHRGQPVRLDRPVVETIAFPDEENVAPLTTRLNKVEIHDLNPMGDFSGNKNSISLDDYSSRENYLSDEEKEVFAEQFGWGKNGEGFVAAAVNNLKHVYDFYLNRNEAGTFAEYNGIFGPGRKGLTDGGRDALRHTFWNARMAQKNPDAAQELADGVERSGTNSSAAHFMDLYNNRVGRRIGIENPNASNMEMRRLVEEAYRRGELIRDIEEARLRLNTLIEERRRRHNQTGR